MAAYDRDITITHTLKDCYKVYRRRCAESTRKHISFNQFKEVCYRFNSMLSESIIKQSFDYKIPFGLGSLRIRKNKQKFKIIDGKLKPRKKMIDWYQTRYVLWERLYPGKTRSELKEIQDKPLVMFTNEHSNGEIMRWYWNKKNVKVTNSRVYMFRPVKKNRLDLAKHIKNENRENDYAF